MPKKTDEKEPKAVGRPPSRGEASKMVGVRLTESEREACAADAKTRGVPLSEWIRRACRAFLPKELRARFDAKRDG